MNKIIKEFNETFERDAKITILNNKLVISIASRTMVISLPVIVGLQARELSQNP